jgi:hypothetical protein
MTNAILQMPLDGVGKKVDALQLSVGGNLVLQQRVVARRHERTLTTRYHFTTAGVVGAAADGALAGRVYVENDPDSTVLIAVTRVKFTSQHASVLATPTAPRFVLRSFTFTGNTPSGTAVTGVKQDSSLAAKDLNWNVRTVSTGMTITEAGDLETFYPVGALTAVAASTPHMAEWKPESDVPLILRAGEGLMLKQIDAGTTSDTRVWALTVDVDEWTVAA